MNINMEEMHRARYVGKDVELPCFLQEHHSSIPAGIHQVLEKLS